MTRYLLFLLPMLAVGCLLRAVPAGAESLPQIGIAPSDTAGAGGSGRFSVFGNSPEREAFFADQARILEDRRQAEAALRAQIEADARAAAGETAPSQARTIYAGGSGIDPNASTSTRLRTSPPRPCDPAPQSDAPFRDPALDGGCPGVIVYPVPGPVVVVPVTPTPRPGVTVTLGPQGLSASGRIVRPGFEFRFNTR